MKKNRHQKIEASRSDITERYFDFLSNATYTTEGGKQSLYTSSKFIGALRNLEADKARSGSAAVSAEVSARLMGAHHVWFMSDLHLGHVALLKLRGYPEARNTSEVDNKMLTNILETVKQDDLLIIGGDLCMGDLAVANDFLRQIRCRKALVLGNHDVDREGRILRFHVEEIVSHLSFEFDGRQALVTHYPVSTDVLDSIGPEALNIHGHIHAHELPTDLGTGERHLNMSVEPLNFTPMELRELLAAVAK